MPSFFLKFLSITLHRVRYLQVELIHGGIRLLKVSRMFLWTFVELGKSDSFPTLNFQFITSINWRINRSSYFQIKFSTLCYWISINKLCETGGCHAVKVPMGFRSMVRSNNKSWIIVLIPQRLFWTLRGLYPYRSLDAIQRRPFSAVPLSTRSLSSFVNKAISVISIQKLKY